MADSRARLAFPAVLAFAALVVATPAGRAPLWDPNEARYTLLARDILERGEWLVPNLRGEPYLNKPQLFFWSVAVASLPGGDVTELTAALPAVLSALTMVAAVFAIGVGAWGWRAGATAALALASTIGFFAVGHHGQSDVMVAAWTAWALYFLLAARRGDWRPAPLVGFYACVGGAILSKGPMGLLGLAAGVAAVVAVDGSGALRRTRPALGLVVLAIVLAPWYATYLTGHGSAFVRDVVVAHYGGWVFRRGVLPRLESLWVLAYELPWTPFLVGAVAWWRRAPDPERRLIGVWTLAIWVLIGLSGIHRVRYLIPIYPGLALLAGEFVARAGGRGGARALRGATYAFAALAVVAAGIGLSPLARAIGGEGRPYVPDAPVERALVVALLLAAAVVAVVAARRAAFAVVALAAALGVGALLVVEGVRYPARFARDFDVRPLAAAARELTPPGVTVAAYPGIPLTYDFYLRRPVVELDRAGVERLLAGVPRGALIMSSASWAALRPVAHPAWHVVAARPVASREMVVLGGRGS